MTVTPCKLLVNTNQEAFDAVVRHLKAQNQRAVQPSANFSSGQCMYWTSEGLMCAIGAIVEHPDRLPTGRVGLLIASFAIDPGEVSTALLDKLQWAHDCFNHWDNDNADFNEEGVQYLAEIAAQFDLSLDVLTETFPLEDAD